MNLRVTIIQQFIKLFSLNYFLDTGVNDTLQTADTSKGGFSIHFTNKKDNLYDAVLTEAQRTWLENTRAGLNDLASLIKTTVKFLAHKECIAQQSL